LQIENAIEVAWNPSSEPSIKQQAFLYLQAAKQQPEAWQTFMRLFIRQPRPTDVVRMACLDAVNLAIQMGELNDESLVVLKTTLYDYAAQTYGPTANPQQTDSVWLQNKLCQTFTYIFVSLYKGPWADFVEDMWRLTLSADGTPARNLPGVIFYLRVLGSVHDEIADMLISRSDSEAKRNIEIKDQVRGQDMVKIADSWRLLLSIYCGQDEYVTEMILKLIAKWVSWMDISLIADQRTLSYLLPLLGRAHTHANGQSDPVRDAAIDALTEIAGKKMKLPDKMQLISFLNLKEIVGELAESNSLKGLRGTPEYDTDLAEAVAKLVSTVVLAVTHVLECPESIYGDKELLASADKHLQDFFPFLLRFFSDEYDEVCATVLDGVTNVLTVFRKLMSSTGLPQAYFELLPSILDAVIRKMRFDDSAAWGGSDDETDEAEFHELRKRLANLQKTIAQINKELFVEAMSNLTGNMFQRLGQEGDKMPWQDLELALHEMYLYGDVVLPKTGFASKSFQETVAAERLVLMVKNMVESGKCPVALATTPDARLTWTRHRLVRPSRHCSSVHGELCPLRVRL
jgi:exportin-T